MLIAILTTQLRVHRTIDWVGTIQKSGMFDVQALGMALCTMDGVVESEMVIGDRRLSVGHDTSDCTLALMVPAGVHVCHGVLDLINARIEVKGTGVLCINELDEIGSILEPGCAALIIQVEDYLGLGIR